MWVGVSSVAETHNIVVKKQSSVYGGLYHNAQYLLYNTFYK
jgi:hypothetical protein